ncbi:MAG: 30S ribosome-binding factor RbfA [Proteobacteria bacterium]|nr:30S ribosome-binding factor RbfA [Pseudomonadota bacterium]
MTSARGQRIESEIQRVLAGLIAREVKDPRVGNVTVTRVSAAADMGSVRVYFRPFPGSTHPPAQVQAALTRAGGFLRGEVGRRLSLRHSPRLEFEFDDSEDKAARLEALIDRAVAGDRAAARAAGSGSESDAAGLPAGTAAGDPQSRSR